MKHAPPPQERLTLDQGNDASVDIHLGVPLDGREVLVGIEVTMWPHCLAGKKIERAHQALVNTAERAIPRVAQLAVHVIARRAHYICHPQPSGCRHETSDSPSPTVYRVFPFCQSYRELRTLRSARRCEETTSALWRPRIG